MTKQTVDVVIMGGGLAGLGLAYQLAKANPALSILILEKQSFPRPRAVAKIGESTVEIGSHYLTRDLDLAEHLKQYHLKKFGIRMFFGSDTDNFEKRDELGASQVFGLSTYQIDRGDLENHLAGKVKALGVTIIDTVNIQNFTLPKKSAPTEDIVKVIASTPVEVLNIDTRWLLDASGRAALIKQQQNLSKPNAHQGNAIWFRINKRIEIDAWSEDSQWHARCTPGGKRWLSTNHLVGPGYWVWIIPLASGVTSIGIVIDDQALAESAMCDAPSTLAWLSKHQGCLAKDIGETPFMDFVIANDYSYDCQKIFGSNWAVTGEAGVFTDPLYSPGTDFIAISNHMICDLISSENREEDISFKQALYEKLYFSIYSNTLSLYTNQYGGFGDRQLMGLKLLWDYAYYWGVLSLLFFTRALTNINSLRQVNPLLHKVQMRNQEVQSWFAERALKRQVLPTAGIFMDQYQIPCLQHFNAVLASDSFENWQSELENNINMLDGIAAAIQCMLKDAPKTTIEPGEYELLGNYRQLILA